MSAAAAAAQTLVLLMLCMSVECLPYLGRLHVDGSFLGGDGYFLGGIVCSEDSTAKDGPKFNAWMQWTALNRGTATPLFINGKCFA